MVMDYRISTDWFTNSRGQRLRYREYRPDGEIKAVVAYHAGYREHLDRKDPSLSIICKEGYLIFLVEAHGHGFSEPTYPKYKRFTSESIFHYVDDFTLFIKHIVEKNEIVKQNQLKVYIAGGSMGGLIATLTALKEKSRFSGLILGCPSIDVDRNWIMAIQERIAGILMRIVPYKRIVPALKPEQVTLEPDIDWSIKSDVLMEYGAVAIKQAYQILQGFNYVAAHEHELTLPICILLGTEDKAISHKAVHRLLNKSQTTDKTLKLIDGAAHAMDQGKDMYKFCNAFTSWLNSQTNQQ